MSEKILQTKFERNFTSICIKKETKSKLDMLKLYSESYDAAIKRLIYRRNFDVVNNSIVSLEPVTPEVTDTEEYIMKQHEAQMRRIERQEEIKTIGK